MQANATKAAQLLKTLSNPHRLMVLCSLQEQERSVSELNEQLPLSQSALSQHLAYLRNENLVTTRREGLSIFYQLAEPEKNPAVAIINTLHELYCSEQ